MRTAFRLVFILFFITTASSSCLSSRHEDTSADSGSGAADAGADVAVIEGTWSKEAPLQLARFEAYAAVVGGRIYLIGGLTGIFGSLASIEPSRRVDIFDPASSTWTPGPDLPEDAPKHHLAITVANDAVYVLTGFDGVQGKTEFHPIGVSYVLEGGTTWRKLAPPPLARGAATAQAIDGRIYVTGGAPDEGKPSYDRLDVYDIASNTWSTRAPIPTAREHLGSCVIDGTMIVVGGWKDELRVGQNAAERYDPKTDQWTVLPPMFTRRGALGATTHTSKDGVTRCHVLGGEDWGVPPPGTFAAHEVFDPKTNSWAKGPPMPTARHGIGVASLGGALYVIAGGDTQGSAFLDVIEVFR